jgi:hypothetical protein
MNASQNPTLPAIVPTQNGGYCRADDGEMVPAEIIIKWRHQQYIDWVASGGLRVFEDGTFEEVTATAFAKSVNVSRTTIYDWPRIIPDFQARVAQRRAEIYSGARVNQVWKGVFLKAMTGEAQQADMVLRNFDVNYRSANAKGGGDDRMGLSDLLQKVRNSNAPAEITEGEIVDATPSAG